MGQKNQPLTSSKHHFRPQSRGGNNAPENYQEISHEKLHYPYHHLFSNLRPHEIAILFMFSWGTQYVSLTERSYTPESIHKYEATLESWRILFGKRTSVKSVIRIIQNEFVRTGEDRALMKKVFDLRSTAMGRDISFIDRKRCAPADEKFAWDNNDYLCLFGRLDPHEAILLIFLSWDTVCPHSEYSSPGTFSNAKGEMRKSMKRRTKAWNRFFGGESDPWEAIKTIRSMVNRIDQPIESNLIKRAFAICRAMGSQ